MGVGELCAADLSKSPQSHEAKDSSRAQSRALGRSWKPGHQQHPGPGNHDSQPELNQPKGTFFENFAPRRSSSKQGVLDQREEREHAEQDRTILHGQLLHVALPLFKLHAQRTPAAVEHNHCQMIAPQPAHSQLVAAATWVRYCLCQRKLSRIKSNNWPEVDLTKVCENSLNSWTSAPSGHGSPH